MMNAQKLLTPKQAAHYLNFRPSALAAWRSRGGGPRFAKINGRVCRYTVEDLDAWIAERMRDYQDLETSTRERAFRLYRDNANCKAVTEELGISRSHARRLKKEFREQEGG